MCFATVWSEKNTKSLKSKFFVFFAPKITMIRYEWYPSNFALCFVSNGTRWKRRQLPWTIARGMPLRTPSCQQSWRPKFVCGIGHRDSWVVEECRTLVIMLTKQMYLKPLDFLKESIMILGLLVYGMTIRGQKNLIFWQFLFGYWSWRQTSRGLDPDRSWASPSLGHPLVWWLRQGLQNSIFPRSLQGFFHKYQVWSQWFFNVFLAVAHGLIVSVLFNFPKKSRFG